MFKFNFNADSEEVTKKDGSNEEAALCEAAAEIFPEEDIGNFAHSVVDYEVYKTKGAFLKHVRPQSVLDYLNEHDIKSSVIVAEGSHSDLLAGVYEGGLKVWECTFDLLDYLENESVVFRDTNVLDLGCGAGLLGIYALDKGATTVVFQDYNKEVLRYATIPNALLNGCSAEKFRCFSGDWEWFSGLCKEKFDIILTSETIYNNRNYVKLVDVFKKFLKEGGVIYLAAKSYYFGVGGSVQEFQNTLRKEEAFNVSTVWKCDEGIKRLILKITHVSLSVFYCQ